MLIYSTLALIIFFVKYLLNQPWEEEVYFNLTKLFLKIDYTSEQEIEFLSSYPMLVVTTALPSVHGPAGRGVAWWQDFVITSLAVHGKVGDYWAAGLDHGGGSVHGKVGEGQNAQFQLSSYWSQYNT